jgi:hypothetical protein
VCNLARQCVHSWHSDILENKCRIVNRVVIGAPSVPLALFLFKTMEC